MKYVASLLLVLFTVTTFAQDPPAAKKPNTKKQLRKATEKWDQFLYDEALADFNALLNLEQNNHMLKFRLADCYLNSKLGKDVQKAITLLESIVDSVDADLNINPYDYKERRAPYLTYKVLGKLYRLNYQFDKSIATTKDFEKAIGDKATPEEKEYITRELKICETGKLLVANPVDIKVESLGSKVNSKFPEYAPVLSADEKTLIFTSKRGDSSTVKDPVNHQFYEDIYISKKDANGEWGAPKLISDKINTAGHEATIGLSVDGQQLLIYSAKDDANGDIYYSKLDGDQWTAPVAFEALNSKYSETHACFSADGKTIYFTSDRKGGYGGYDIYRVKMMPDGTWSLPVNLGPKINTKYDDRAPFIHPDGVSLFFSSEGHETMGGFDIFQSTMDELGVWSTPENIGYPINSTDDEAFYVTSVDGKRSYYSSLRQDGMGEKDLYLLKVEKPKVDPLTVMSGKFTLGDKAGTVPEDATIIVTDNETGQIVGIYRPNKKTGKYLFILPPGRNYNVTYEAQGYLFKSENLIVPKNSAFNNIQREIKLSPIKANESIVLNNVFFEKDKARLTPDSKVELEKLFKLLNNNKAIKVEISGHTDADGSDSYNKKLSQKRAESVRRFLVNKGIKGGRITAVGYGESQPIAKNFNADGSKNDEGMQLNRRIELKIISQDGSVDKNTVNKIHVKEELKKK